MTKTYIETKEGSFQIENMSIPNAEGNRHYRMMLAEVEAGEATIQAYDNEADLVAVKTATEQAWVKSELEFADEEIRALEDGDGIGVEQDWRDYRVALRAWAKDPKYPDQVQRPFYITSG